MISENIEVLKMSPEAQKIYKKHIYYCITKRLPKKRKKIEVETMLGKAKVSEW